MRLAAGTIVAALAAACSADDAARGGGDAGGVGEASQGSGGGSAAGGRSTAGGASGSGGTDGAGGFRFPSLDGGSVAMPLISRDVPAFSSNANPAEARGANDDAPDTMWASDRIPAWLAYDLSEAPASQRGQALIVINAWHNADYLTPDPEPHAKLPLDYTIEISSAAGGSGPPDGSWTEVLSVTGNVRTVRAHLVDLQGSSWVRLSVSASSDPGAVGLDVDVYSAPSGATDSWLFMGDSITHMSLSYPFSNLPKLVNDLRPDRWPNVIEAAVGGTGTLSGLETMNEVLEGYPGRFVALAYGTNDNLAEFEMEELVQRIIAMGKTPVVPHIPWSDTLLDKGPQVNAIIDALYEKYPQILPGPDLWSALEGRTDLIPSGDVHPTDPGGEALRQEWARVMAAVP